MRKVTLKFADERDLRQFAQVVACSYVELNTKTLTVTCDCSDAEIELAEKAFFAKLISDVDII